MRYLSALIAILLAAMLSACGPSNAQATLLQAGPVAPGHTSMYVNSGTSQPVVQDSGTSAGGAAGVGLSELGMTVRGTGTPPYAGQGKGQLGTNFCDYDAPITTASGYHFFCMSPNAQGGGLLAYGAAGTATVLPFNFYVNGTFYQFPFAVGGIVGPNSSTVGHIATWNNSTGSLLADGGAIGPLSTLGIGVGLNSGGGNLNVSSPASGDLLGSTPPNYVIANNAVTQAKIAAGAVGTAQIANNAVTATQIAAGAVGSTQLASLAVATGNIAANAVTNAKAAQMTAGTIKCNYTSATANPVDCAGNIVTGAYSVTAYGAKCDHSTDDTAAINTAIAAVPVNGLLIFPSGVECEVSGSGLAIFERDLPIQIDCQGSTINVTSATTSTDLFRFAPVSSGLYRRWSLENCLLQMNSSGSSTIEINTTSSTSTEVADFDIGHITDRPVGSSVGASIAVLNSLTNLNGGTFNANFHDNVLVNGIVLANAGDSIRIQDNELAGSKYGVYADLIAGAGNFLVVGNNITAACQIVVLNAEQTVIQNNEIEASQANTCPDGGLIDINAGHVPLNMGSVIITNNQVRDPGNFAGGKPDIFVASAMTNKVFIDQNELQNPSAVCIVNAGGNTTVGAGNNYAVCSPHVTNTGTLNYVQVGASP